MTTHSIRDGRAGRNASPHRSSLATHGSHVCARVSRAWSPPSWPLLPRSFTASAIPRTSSYVMGPSIRSTGSPPRSPRAKSTSRASQSAGPRKWPNNVNSPIGTRAGRTDSRTTTLTVRSRSPGSTCTFVGLAIGQSGPSLGTHAGGLRHCAPWASRWECYEPRRRVSVMRALVAGGAGFIGSHLCERLIDEGRSVICLDNFLTGRRANVEHLLSSPRFQLFDLDVIEGAPEVEVERIYHLASPASPPGYTRFPLETMRVNSEGSRRLLELAVSTGARFLYASTSEVYGDPLEHPQREGYRGNVSSIGPRSMYDEAKRFGEAMTMAYHNSHFADVRIARIFNTYS